MAEETVIINRTAVLDFVFGPTREEAPPPAPASVVTEEEQEEPEEERTEVKLDPFLVGGIVPPAPASVVAKEVQKEPEEDPTEVRLDPYFVGEIVPATPLGARDVVVSPFFVSVKSDEEMRREFEEHEWREEQKLLNTPRAPTPAPLDRVTPREKIERWLRGKGMSATTCRRMHMPEMILELRGKDLDLSEEEANKHLRELEDEEHGKRAKRIALALAHS